MTYGTIVQLNYRPGKLVVVNLHGINTVGVWDCYRSVYLRVMRNWLEMV